MGQGDRWKRKLRMGDRLGRSGQDQVKGTNHLAGRAEPRTEGVGMPGCRVVGMLKGVADTLIKQPSIEHEATGDEPKDDRPRQRSVHEPLVCRGGEAALVVSRATVR